MELSKELEPGFIRDIIELKIAVEVQNKGWARKIILKMLGWGPEELAFRVQRHAYGEGKNLLPVINQLGGSVVSLMEGRFLSQAWSNKIQVLLKGEPGEEAWSLSTIRKKLKSNRIHEGVRIFLFQQLLLRTSSQEVSLLLQKSMDRDFLEGMDLRGIWLFNHHYPVRDDLRAVAWDKIHSAWEDGEPWLRYQVIQLLTNPAIKKDLARREPMFKKPLFQIQRRFYRSLLFGGQAIDLALYNLMALGDNSHRNLWWLAF